MNDPHPAFLIIPLAVLLVLLVVIWAVSLIAGAIVTGTVAFIGAIWSIGHYFDWWADW